jgi:hypothetical protein
MITHMLTFAGHINYWQPVKLSKTVVLITTYLLFGNKHTASLSSGAFGRPLPSSSVMKNLSRQLIGKLALSIDGGVHFLRHSLSRPVRASLLYGTPLAAPAQLDQAVRLF